MKDLPTQLHFGPFELDLEEEVLRKRGTLIKLQAQPLKILTLLVARPGELISRDEIRRHVWGDDTFVDFDQGINVCIRQIRQALGDHAGSPRFIETVPRKGYRFLAPVDRPLPSPALPKPPPSGRRSGSVAILFAVLAASLLVVGGSRAWSSLRTTPQPAISHPTAATEASMAGVLLVLPFLSYSAGGEDDYLGDGLTEELITEISRRYGGRLGVIARTSAMKYKHTDLSIREIAAELGVDFVLEGSVRRAQERLRVTAQLIRAEDELHLWAGNYDRPLVDFIALQSEVSAKIGQALALELELEPAHPSPGLAATGAQAYEAYLRGRQHLTQRDSTGFWPPDAVIQAQNHFEEATELDPGFAPAWIELSTTYRLTSPSPEGTRQARQAVERALALNDGSPRAHRALAWLRFYDDWDFEGARQSFERALELDPGFAKAHHDFAAYFSVTGQPQKAVRSVQRALRLDPLSPGVTSDVGWYYYFGGHYLEAIVHSRRTLELEPGYFWAKRCILLAAIAAGDFETAAAQARDDLQQLGAPEELQRSIAGSEPSQALSDYWNWRLDRLQTNIDERSPPWSELAHLHMVLGNHAAALTTLERAHAARRGWILPFLGVHPLFAPLRTEPRFQALVEHISSSPSSV